MKIPFLNLSNAHHLIKDELEGTFSKVLTESWFVLGKELEAFEKEYANFNDVQYCIGVSNGLDALHLALRALGISKGDEVLLPSNTYIATVLAVSYVGATPVLVEPRINTYNINPDLIENAITPNTKVIMPVHLYGQACEMEAIRHIADKYGLFIIEDNAQSQGATYNGRITGSWGEVNGTSFYPGKNLGALGDAGAITTNNIEIDRKLRMLRNYGSEKKYYNEVIGYNMRLDELQAAFLRVKLKRLNEWTGERRQIASWYNERLKGIGDLILPEVANFSTHVYHLFVVRTQFRDDLQKYLNNNGIGTLIHYPIPPHLQEAYKHLNFKYSDFPIAEKIAQTSLSLPLWPGITFAEVEFVCCTIKKYFDSL